MNTEQRALYNKNYYEKNKVKLISNGCAKVVCPFCLRTVIKNNLLVHQSKQICKKHESILLNNKLRNDRNEMLLSVMNDNKPVQ